MTSLLARFQKPAPKTQSLRLFEDRYSFEGGNDRVDHENAIIKGVKLVGLQSGNTGRTIGLSRAEFGTAVDAPYSYDPKALQEALALYENAPARLNHPQTRFDANGQRHAAGSSRGLFETVGGFKNARIGDDGGVYADFHLYKNHPSTPLLLEMAEKTPDKIAFSHNAFGRPTLRNGRAVIDKIFKVDSVDLVGDKPGTTNGLFESQAEEPRTMKRTIRQICAAAPATCKGRKLLEDMGDDTVDNEPVQAMEVDVPEDADSDMQIDSALEAVVLGIFRDESLDASGKLAKLKKIFKFQDEIAGKDSGEEVATTESLANPKDPLVKQLTETVAQLKAERDEAKADSSARQLVESMGRVATTVQLEAVKAMPNDASRKQLIETFAKRDERAESRQVPRPAASPSAHTMETESATLTREQRWARAKLN